MPCRPPGHAIPPTLCGGGRLRAASHEFPPRVSHLYLRSSCYIFHPTGFSCLFRLRVGSGALKIDTSPPKKDVIASIAVPLLVGGGMVAFAAANYEKLIDKLNDGR